MKVIYDIKDLMEDELKQFAKKETLSKDDVCVIGEMIDIVKDIETIEAMQDAAAKGWSRDYGTDYSRGYDDDYSNAYRYSYEGRRGRDAMGRYTSRDDGYSRHSKDEMIKHLEQMMMNARTPEERENYRATIDQMNKDR
jgi:hypothetical protein